MDKRNNGSLYLVGTPIGNLGDITLRALETLKTVDVIACEDTRHSLKLLNHYEIKKPLIACHMHNESGAADKIIELLSEGKNVALISDAGMPCISDPGAELVTKTRAAGLNVSVVPGATAVTSAMALSGINRRGFCFIGFLPDKKQIKNLLEPYINIDIQMVFYSAPHDINDDLAVLHKFFGDRKIVVVKEITKMHESVVSGTLGAFNIEDPRGEYVIIVEGRVNVCEYPATVEAHYEENYLKLNDKKEAIKATAKERGVPKDVVYKIVMNKN